MRVDVLVCVYRCVYVFVCVEGGDGLLCAGFNCNNYISMMTAMIVLIS